MGDVFSKNYWDQQGEQFEDFFKETYHIGSELLSANEKFWSNAVTAQGDVGCKLFGAGCSKPQPMSGAMLGRSGNINYSGSHVMMPQYARLGPVMPPSQVARIQNPQAKMAVASTRGVQRQGLQALANVADTQAVNSTTPQTSNIAPQNAPTPQ